MTMSEKHPEARSLPKDAGALAGAGRAGGIPKAPNPPPPPPRRSQTFPPSSRCQEPSQRISHTFESSF